MHFDNEKLGIDLLDCVKTNNFYEFKKIITEHKFNPVLDTFPYVTFEDQYYLTDLHANNVTSIVSHYQNKKFFKFIVRYAVDNDIDVTTEIKRAKTSSIDDVGYPLMSMLVMYFKDDLQGLELMASKQPEAALHGNGDIEGPLMYSVQDGNLKAFKIMAKYIHAESIPNDVVLKCSRSVYLLKLLYDHDIDLDLPGDFNKERPIHVCAKTGNLAGLEFLDSIGVNFDAKDQHGNSVMEGANIFGHQNTISYLIAREVLNKSMDEVDSPSLVVSP